MNVTWLRSVCKYDEAAGKLLRLDGREITATRLIKGQRVLRVQDRKLGLDMPAYVAAAVLAFDVPEWNRNLRVFTLDGNPNNLDIDNLGALYQDEQAPVATPFRLCTSNLYQRMVWYSYMPEGGWYFYQLVRPVAHIYAVHNRVYWYFGVSKHAERLFYMGHPPPEQKENTVLTPEILEAAFRYDPLSGDFYSRSDPTGPPIRGRWYPKKQLPGVLAPFRLRSLSAGLNVRSDVAAAIINYGVDPTTMLNGDVVLLDGDPQNNRRDNIGTVTPVMLDNSPVAVTRLTLSHFPTLARVAALDFSTDCYSINRFDDVMTVNFPSVWDAMQWLINRCGLHKARLGQGGSALQQNISPPLLSVR